MDANKVQASSGEFRDIDDYFKAADEFWESLCSVSEIALAHRLSEDWLTLLLSGELPENEQVDLVHFEDDLREIFSVCEEPRFDDFWLEEVSATRQRAGVGKYKIRGVTSALLENSIFDSAFHLTAVLSNQFGCYEYEHRFEQVFSSDWRDQGLAYPDSESVLILAALLGAVSIFDIYIPSEHQEELLREVWSVEHSRKTGSSWQHPNLVTNNVSDTSKLRIRNLSGFQKLLVQSLFQNSITNEETSVSAEYISSAMRAPNDSRLRGTLSNLRNQGWLGGNRGEHGYWLSENGWAEIAKGTEKSSTKLDTDSDK